MIPLVLEMGWPNGNESRAAIVMQHTQGAEGVKSGELVIAGVPIEAAKNLLHGSRLRWNWAIDMRVGANKEQLTNVEKRWKRMHGDGPRHRRKAISQLQHLGWKTTMYRRANDIRKVATPSLKKYEWCVVEKALHGQNIRRWRT